MKKLIYGTILLAFITVGVFGCKKEKLITNQNTVTSQTGLNLKSLTVETIEGLEKAGSILKFETIDDYINFVEDTLDSKWTKLDEFSNANGFENYFIQNPSTPSDVDSLEMDEMFGKLLNGDGVIILGQYAIKIDLTKQSAFVTKVIDLKDKYTDLVTGNTANKNIKAYSTDDDVIDALIDGITFKCGGSAGFLDNSAVFGPSGFGLVGGETVQFRARYFKGAIYFSVRIKGYHYPNEFGVYGTNPNLRFEIRSDSPNWKAMRMRPRPCNNNNNVYHLGGMRNFDGSGVWSSDATGRYQTWKGYERVRGLNGYRIWIRGYINNQLSSPNWVGREVNSNF